MTNFPNNSGRIDPIRHFSLPDSNIAERATRFVSEVAPQFLFYHSMRAFLFADALGKRDGLKYDRELLYLGAVLHDVGLSESFPGKERFEVEGADAARALVLEHGLAEEKAEIIWDAIALHTTVAVALRKQPEIALVALGTALDVSGRRLDELDPRTVADMLEVYPRSNFKEAAFELLVSYAKRHPKHLPFTWMADVARTCPEVRCPTIADVIRSSPFKE